jgi:D-tyrosyl-tRNA(Tyr) deacylase
VPVSVSSRAPEHDTICADGTSSVADDPDRRGSVLGMRGLVQRVRRASVDVVHDDGSVERSGEIGPGLCVLVGATHDDDVAAADRLADKIWHLRVLDDADGVMNVSLAARHEAGDPAEVLVVSQFTLYGNTDKGRRPSWAHAARPEHAEPLVERVADRLRAAGATVATGRFRTEMRVDLTNDGPVTLLLET